MAMALMYNGVQYAPVSTKRSIVVPCSADVLWSVVGKFGKQALWMGTVDGQPIFTQLLVGAYTKCLTDSLLQSLDQNNCISHYILGRSWHFLNLSCREASQQTMLEPSECLALLINFSLSS